MKLSLTSWSLPACTLQEAADISKALGVNALDVGLFYRSALDRKEIIADPRSIATRCAALELQFQATTICLAPTSLSAIWPCRERLNRMSPISNRLWRSAISPTSKLFLCFPASSTLVSPAMTRCWNQRVL